MLVDISKEFLSIDAELANARNKQGQNKKKKVKKSRTFKDKKNREAFYAFSYENDEGFRIISADKRLEPILAYNDSGYFDVNSVMEIPGLNDWIISMQEHVTGLREDNTNSEKKVNIASGWTHDDKNSTAPYGRTEAVSSTISVGPLINTKWGQGCGYNDFTPTKSKGPCGHAPAGCGPVAVAQVMWYHRSKLPSTTYNGVPINYNNMVPNPISGAGWNPDILRLMRFIGDWIIIDWAADYAMALPGKIPDFLEMNGFNSDLKDLNHNVVRSSIQAGNPVIFKARTSGVLGISFNHHIWVCEGYRNLPSETYYMNWGWRGNGDGWFAINTWKPEGSREYSKDRKMITASR